MTIADRDFPAAHSMDTSWFAIDADGVVAHFDTGEDGALPIHAAHGPGADDPSFDHEALEVALLLRAALSESRQSADDIRGRANTMKGPEEVLIALSGDDAAALLPESRYTVLREAGPRVARSRGPASPDTVRKLVESGRVRALYIGGEIEDLTDTFSGLPEMVCYQRDHGDEPGAYARKHLPTDPIRVDELPAEVATALSALRLPIQFTRTESLQLADHMDDAEAHYWGEGWTLRGFGPEPPPGQQAPPRAGRGWVVVLALVLAAVALFLVLR